MKDRKEIRLKRKISYYGGLSCWYENKRGIDVCQDKVIEFFGVPEDNIDAVFVFSNRKLSNSYTISVVTNTYGDDIVKLDNEYQVYLLEKTFNYVKRAIKQGYTNVRVEYDS